MFLQWLAVGSVATWFVHRLIRNLDNRPSKARDRQD